MRQPNIGDQVIVPADPGLNNGAATAPAIVTRVWGENNHGWTVNLRVLLDGPDVPWRTSQILADTEELARNSGSTAIAWHRPSE